MAKTGRIQYAELSRYNNNVFVGNWLEERSRYVKERHHHISTYHQDFDPKPTSKLDPDVMWDRVFQGTGIGARLLFDHDSDNYQKNFSTTADLSYNHFVKWYAQNPVKRHLRFRMQRWEPEQDLTRNYGPITNYGIVARKEQLWEDENFDPRRTVTTQYQDSYVPPDEEARRFKRFGTPIQNSSILNRTNNTGLMLKLRNKPMSNVTPNEDLVVVQREPRCNPITWECADTLDYSKHRCIEHTNTYKKPSKANKAKAARSVRQQTKRPCGAELKRRRKARKALENDTYNMPPSSTQGTIGMNGTVDRVAPKRKNTKQPKHQNKASFSKRRSVSSESQQPHASTSRKDHSVKKLNNPSSSFIEPTKRHLRVAIIDKNNNTGKLSQTEADIVKKTLSKQLQDFLLSAEDGTPPPRFSSFKYWGGVIKVTCDDDNSLTWLKRTITFMQPWTGATLDIVEIDLLHRLAKITIWIPGEEGEEVDRDRTIKLLTRQNPELSIPNWILFQYEDKSGEGQLFLFGVDDKTLPLLEKKNNRISYGLNSLTVNVKPADEKLEEESIETRRDISPVLQRAASSTVDTESWGTKQPASSRWDMKEVATGKKQAPYCPFEASVKQELVDLDEGDSFLDQAVDMNLFNIPNIRDV